jgi:hypothetical protein
MEDPPPTPEDSVCFVRRPHNLPIASVVLPLNKSAVDGSRSTKITIVLGSTSVQRVQLLFPHALCFFTCCQGNSTRPIYAPHTPHAGYLFCAWVSCTTHAAAFPILHTSLQRAFHGSIDLIRQPNPADLKPIRSTGFQKLDQPNQPIHNS